MIVPSIVCLLALASPTLALPPRSRALYQRATSTLACPTPSTVTVTVTAYLSATTQTFTSTTVSPSSPTAASYISLGCISDDSSRVMNQTRTSVKSVDECARIGKASGRRYFGIENGFECYVTDVLSKNIPSAGCDTPCSSGSIGGGCGGPWRLNLYEFSSASSIPSLAASSALSTIATATTSSSTVSSSTPAATSGYTYQGCIADSSSRAMNQTWTSTNSMTIVQCSDIAKAAGRRYFGLQNGAECFVSDTLAFQTASTGCTIKCLGDQSAVCGGSWTISLYALNDKSPTASSIATSAATTTQAPSVSSRTAAATSSFSQYSTCPVATSTSAAPVSTATICYDFLCPPRENAAVRPAIEAAFDEVSNRISCRYKEPAGAVNPYGIKLTQSFCFYDPQGGWRTGGTIGVVDCPGTASPGTCAPANQIPVGWSKSNLAPLPNCNGKWCYKWLCPSNDKLNRPLSYKNIPGDYEGNAYSCVYGSDACVYYVSDGTPASGAMFADSCPSTLLPATCYDTAKGEGIPSIDVPTAR